MISQERNDQIRSLPAGAYKSFDVNGRKILVAHLADRFTAVENRCSHAGSTFAGPIIRGNQIACPIHGARFDLVTGAPKCAPAFHDIAVFPVRIVQGRIEVAVPPRT